jgi:alpha-1,3-rhamnosyl/mannosyltransferase
LHVLVGAHFTASLVTSNDSHVHYVQTGPYHRLPYLLWQQSQALSRLRYDWFLSTFFLPLATPRTSALFVHDLSFLSLPKSYPPSMRLYMRWLVASAVRRAERIIVLSEFVRSEVQRFYPAVSPSKVFVVYPGYGEDFNADASSRDADIKARYSLDQDYILSVTNIHPRKNLLGLLAAYRLLRQHIGDQTPQLLIVGKRYWGNSSLETEARDMGVRLLGYVPQADLPGLYRAAKLFVYPSLYEGFGLPPLEAMASGVPVVCGNNSSLPEAVGDAALLVDMRQPQEVARALGELILNHLRRIQLKEQGLQQASQFSWQRAAHELVTVLYGT